MALPFKHTHPGPDPTSKLYQVKGKGKIWVRHWDPSWASFNTGDCFLLNLGQVGGGLLCAPLSSGVSISSMECLFSLGHLSLHRTDCLSSSWAVCLSFQWPLAPIHRVSVYPLECPSSYHGISLDQL